RRVGARRRSGERGDGEPVVVEVGAAVPGLGEREPRLVGGGPDGEQIEAAGRGEPDAADRAGGQAVGARGGREGGAGDERSVMEGRQAQGAISGGEPWLGATGDGALDEHEVPAGGAEIVGSSVVRGDRRELLGQGHLPARLDDRIVPPRWLAGPHGA